jgi:geranylgeranyl diphosphate synthase type 3
MFLYSCDIIENLNISLNSNQSGILRQQTRDEELKKYCVTLLEKFGSLSYTRQTLEELDAEARAEVATHGGNPMLEDFLNELLEWKKWSDENKPVQ